jgi:hypothetical protein
MKITEGQKSRDTVPLIWIQIRVHLKILKRIRIRPRAGLDTHPVSDL